MINRDYYLDKLVKAQDNDFIKIITGIRRCGKSTLLMLFKEHLLNSGIKEEQIIEINYEKYSFATLKDEAKLNEFVAAMIKQKPAKYYLLIDEIQELPCWAKVINSMRVSFPLDIYVTGSNSRVFSGEYLTYITGRYIEIKVYPLSLEEFIRFRNSASQTVAANFNDYLRLGSFPATALANGEDLIEAINAGLFESIFNRDILARGQIRDEGNFYKVAKYIFDNIGNSVSINSISNTLKSAGSKISVDAIDNYLKLMCNAFVLYQCERYDIRGRERLRTNGKYYATDLGMRNRLLGYRNDNMGHVLENLVFLELKRRGYEVSVGKIGTLEIDFIAVKGNSKIYLQVAASAIEDSVLKREYAPFYLVKDNNPKILLTMDETDLSYDGFKHLNLLNFLLGADL